MAGIGWEFTKVFTFNGTSYTDVTLESQSSAGTAFAILGAANHYLYLGHDSKFDMAIFDLDIVGSLGVLTWQYYNGSAWTTFTPASSRYALDPDDNEGVAYAFDKDGTEVFPVNLLDSWATTAINSVTKSWGRVRTASASTAPTIKRILCRPIAAYTTSKQVFELLQLKNITNTTDFTTATVPTKDTVETYINEAQSYIDMNTRKSWRPTYVHDEAHEFNLNGFKLDKSDCFKIQSLKIWNGASWDIKAQGRKNDYFLVPDTGMVQFARYFLLPARFTSYNAPVWRWGGGEFTQPIKVSYLAGRDINTDSRQGGMVQDICKKMAAIDVMRSADFGNIAVSGMDRVSGSEKISAWQEEIEDRLDFLTAFEVF